MSLSGFILLCFLGASLAIIATVILAYFFSPEARRTRRQARNRTLGEKLEAIEEEILDTNLAQRRTRREDAKFMQEFEEDTGSCFAPDRRKMHIQETSERAQTLRKLQLEKNKLERNFEL